MVQPAGLVWRIPNMLDVRNEAGNDDEVFRTLSEDLIGDMHIATFGVTDFGRHSMFSLPQPAAAACARNLMRTRLLKHNRSGLRRYGVGESGIWLVTVLHVRFGSKADMCSALGDVRLVHKRTC